MLKVALLISMNIMKVRVEKLLTQNNAFEVAHISSHRTNMMSPQNLFKDFSLILIDLDHQDLDGLELIRKIRNTPETLYIPIVVLSDHTDMTILNKALAAGCSEFILKPFIDEIFIEKIQSIVSQAGVQEGKTEHGKQRRSTETVMKEEEIAIKWNSDFRLGIEAIDEEHRQIIESYGKLYNLMREGHGHEYYQDLLLFLKSYVSFHFENEERFQREINYDKIEDHHQVHEAFKKQIQTLLEAHLEKPVTNADLIKMNLFVKGWLTHHILSEDKKFGDFYRQQHES